MTATLEYTSCPSEEVSKVGVAADDADDDGGPAVERCNTCAAE